MAEISVPEQIFTGVIQKVFKIRIVWKLFDVMWLSWGPRVSARNKRYKRELYRACIANQMKVQ